MSAWRSTPASSGAKPGVDAFARTKYTVVMATVPKRQRLTEAEGRVLALAARLETPTTYTIFAVLDGSPTTSLQASKGAIYPIIERLKQRGYVSAVPVPDSGRGAESLSVTEAGIAAIREWVTDLRDEHILAYDPLRMRIPALQFLTHEERLEWLANAKRLNQQKADEIDAYQAEVEMAYASIAHDAAFSALWAQSKWLDKLFIELVDGRAEVRPTRLKKA